MQRDRVDTSRRNNTQDQLNPPPTSRMVSETPPPPEPRDAHRLESPLVRARNGSRENIENTPTRIYLAPLCAPPTLPTGDRPPLNPILENILYTPSTSHQSGVVLSPLPAQEHEESQPSVVPTTSTHTRGQASRHRGLTGKAIDSRINNGRQPHLEASLNHLNILAAVATDIAGKAKDDLWKVNRITTSAQIHSPQSKVVKAGGWADCEPTVLVVNNTHVANAEQEKNGPGKRKKQRASKKVDVSVQTEPFYFVSPREETPSVLIAHTTPFTRRDGMNQSRILIADTPEDVLLSTVSGTKGSPTPLPKQDRYISSVVDRETCEELRHHTSSPEIPLMIAKRTPISHSNVCQGERSIRSESCAVYSPAHAVSKLASLRKEESLREYLSTTRVTGEEITEYLQATSTFPGVPFINPQRENHEANYVPDSTGNELALSPNTLILKVLLPEMTEDEIEKMVKEDPEAFWAALALVEMKKGAQMKFQQYL